MKKFIISHRQLLILIALIMVLIVVFTGAGIIVPQFTGDRTDNGISTCSTPTGEQIAKGIDVSKYQGEIDFDKVKKAGYDFVIIRVGTSQGGKDSNFETNYINALKAGLDIGCYYYTYAYTAAEVKSEAKQVLEYINDKSFNYPVFLDFEYSALMKYKRVDENTNMINTFCNVIKKSGYYPGVYTSVSIYNNYIDNRILGQKWDFWVAAYLNGTSDSTKYSKSFSMWQYTSNGTVSGINARVDLNVAYVDYPEIIKEFNKKYKELVVTK